VTEIKQVTEQFECIRPRLRALAYHILGSLADADDALQETWIKVSGSDPSSIKNVDAWLTTVTGRVCLDLLRARKLRREYSERSRFPDPLVTRGDQLDPEQQVLLGNCIGLALLVVIQSLSPPERIAYVLHDMFDMSFEDIGAILERTALAARKVASRARRRVQGSTITATDMDAQRNAVEAFTMAVQDGNFEMLLEILDPSIVLRTDRGTGVFEILGASKIARRAIAVAKLVGAVQRALVNGTAGIVALDERGEPMSIMAFTVTASKIIEIHILADRGRLGRLTPAPFVRLDN
jgi:RNA polymerase sigma-70 factor (ECF subfamily)